MKKALLSLVFLGSIGMIQSQNTFQVEPAYASSNEFEVSTAVEVLNMGPLDEKSISIENGSADLKEADEENNEYLNEVQSSSTPEAVRKYQFMASQYDVAETNEFDGRNSPFELIFETKKGMIRATYDENGEILRSEERFHNVAMPNDMIQNVMKEHKGWKIVGNSYNLSYIKDENVRKYYKVQISNGHKKKRIKVDMEGMIH